jgi:hypothetical protein
MHWWMKLDLIVGWTHTWLGSLVGLKRTALGSPFGLCLSWDSAFQALIYNLFRSFRHLIFFFFLFRKIQFENFAHPFNSNILFSWPDTSTYHFWSPHEANGHHQRILFWQHYLIIIPKQSIKIQNILVEKMTGNDIRKLGIWHSYFSNRDFLTW